MGNTAMTDQEIIAAASWQDGPTQDGRWSIAASVGDMKAYRRGGPKPVGVSTEMAAEPTEAERAVFRANLERAIIARWREYNGDAE